jgi:adenylate kinase
MSEPIRLVILGRQGSGKGTQGVRLADHLGIAHISTGDMLRAAAEEGTPMGLEAKVYMDDGKLLPDDVMRGVVAERLAQPDAAEHGFILDGFPRTTGQAEALGSMAELDLVIDLDVPRELVTERLLARGREDDSPEGIETRLDIYEADTRPLLAFYGDKGLLVTVDGVGTEDEVEARLVAAIDAAHAS